MARPRALLLLLCATRCAAQDTRYACPATSRCWCRNIYYENEITIQANQTYAEAFNRLTQQHEVLYGDLYVPPWNGSDPPLRPGFVSIHGGNWAPSSSRKEHVAADQALRAARHGFVAFNIEYRKEGPLGTSGGYVWSDTVADGRAAMRYLIANAGRLRLDAGRIAVFGDSAGAETAAGLAYMKDSVTPADPMPRAAVGLSGCLFNDTVSQPNIHTWNGLYAAGPSSPPYLDIHGTEDDVVPYDDPTRRYPPNLNHSCSAVLTHKWLTAQGARNGLVAVPGAGHVPTEGLYNDPYKTTFWGFLRDAMGLTDAMCPY